jgi:hypothetical protein
MPTWSQLTGTWADQIGTWEGVTEEGVLPDFVTLAGVRISRLRGIRIGDLRGILIGGRSGLFVFEPPIVAETPRVSYPISESDERFWNHFRRPPVGQNVFKLKDGSYTFTQPASDADVDIWYLGGHIYLVDAEEAASLEAAGFTVQGDVVPPVGEPGSRVGDLAGTLVGDLLETTIGNLQ